MSEFNPFGNTPKHSRERVSRIFGKGSSGKLAQETKMQNPALYAELRQAAVFYGLLCEVPMSPLEKLLRPKERVFSADEIRCRIRFSEAEVKALYGKGGNDLGAENLNDIAQKDPQRYEDLRCAARSYGFALSERQTQGTAKPHAAAEDNRFLLSDELALKANLPVGTRVTSSELDLIISGIVEVQTAKEAAATEAK
ncbi:MAG TPA: hypothetical protein VGU63_07190 [Candidatus Acidoferrales bacterium]|nr:hypothetical protein [Candidatus Acidoferrales bacterium]